MHTWYQLIEGTLTYAEKAEYNLSVEGHEFVREEVQRPACASLWWFTTDEAEEVSFSFTVGFSFVPTIGRAAMNRRDPSFGVGFARIVDSFRLFSGGSVLTCYPRTCVHRWK